MSFELNPDESLRKNIRRILRDQMDKALEYLTGPHEGSRDEAVHEARKSFKKLRAVLRLVRPVVDERSYREENTCFRDAGRPLTEVRDAKILIETLDHIAEHFKEHVVGRSFDEVRRELQKKLRVVRKRVLDEQDAFAVVAKAVRQAHGRVKAWADVPNKWMAVGEGLKDVYRRAGDAHEEAIADPTVETLHEWRKQAKYLRYQLGDRHHLKQFGERPSMDVELATRLDRIEGMLAALVERQTIKDYYSTEEFARLVGRSEFTAREWCRLGRIRAEKRRSGRGAHSAWVISHQELMRYQREGLLPQAGKSIG
jgi:hypothetical protein